jgi:hypothetical protein
MKYIYIYLIIVLVSLSGCVRVKGTFKEEYSSKLKVKPGSQVAMSNDDANLFMISQSDTKINDRSVYTFHSVSTSNGQIKWSEKLHKMINLIFPPANIVIIEDLNIALVMGKAPVERKSLFVINLGPSAPPPPKYYIKAIDLNNKKEIWSRVETEPSYSIGGLYIAENKSYMIKVPSGLEAFDVATGNIIWSINQSGVRDFGKLSEGLEYNPNSGFIYLESIDRLLFNFSNGNIALLNQYEGRFEWVLKNKGGGTTNSNTIGRIFNADIFEEEGLAVFYGPVAVQTNKAIAQTTNRTLNRLDKAMDRVSSGLARGVQVSPIFLVDLKNGQLRWSNNFMTNDQHKILISQNRLLVNSIVTTAFDLETGEKTWQNVPQKDLDKDGLFGLFAEFTGIDYSTDRLKSKDAVVLNDLIFVVFPEMLENRRDKKNVSIRLYDFIKGEMLWKTTPANISVKDFFFESGILFVVIDGRFSFPSKILAYNPSNGELLYEIDNRDQIRDVIVTDQLLICLGTNRSSLNIYELSNGKPFKAEIPKNISRFEDLGDHFFVVNFNFRDGKTNISTYDRNNFTLIKQMAVPFYSDNIFTANDKVFMHLEAISTKGIVHLDFNKMEVYDYATISTSSDNSNAKELIENYNFILSHDAAKLYVVGKKVIKGYTVK